MNQLENKIQRNEKINRTYALTAKVDVRKIPIEDLKRDGSKITYTSDMIYLIPDVSTQASMFFDAWLPSLSYKDNGEIYHHEVILRFGHPLYRDARFGVCRKNKNYPDAHHLVLMDSESAEDVLKQMFGQRVQFTVMPDMAEANG